MKITSKLWKLRRYLSFQVFLRTNIIFIDKDVFSYGWTFKYTGLNVLILALIEWVLCIISNKNYIYGIKKIIFVVYKWILGYSILLINLIREFVGRTFDNNIMIHAYPKKKKTDGKKNLIHECIYF